MEANRFYSVPYDGHHWADFAMLDMLQGHELTATTYGRYHILLGMLYQQGGRIELTASWRRMIGGELALDDDALQRFLEDCAEAGLLAGDLLELGVAASQGVAKELARREDYREQQKAKSRKGVQVRQEKAAQKREKEAKKETEKEG